MVSGLLDLLASTGFYSEDGKISDDNIPPVTRDYRRVNIVGAGKLRPVIKELQRHPDENETRGGLDDDDANINPGLTGSVFGRPLCYTFTGQGDGD